MSHTQILLAGAVCVIVVLGAALISSWLRRLHWEERLVKWRFRMFLHTLALLAVIAGVGYLYLHANSQQKSPAKPAASAPARSGS
jgi:NADH:ubiquinone oxidoreductase subunit 6 (subunit J)